MSTPTPIIDSHIHLWALSHVPSLAWATPTHALARACSVPEYTTTIKSGPAPHPEVRGFILVEADRRHDLSAGLRGCQGPLEEVEWMARLAGKEVEEDDDEEEEEEEDDDDKIAPSELCLALVPWAPIPLGSAKLEAYLDRVRTLCGPKAWPRVKGFRYLVQDLPRGTMLTNEFIDSLKLLGRRGFIFELGIDQHHGGKWQLTEAFEMITRAQEGVEDDEKVAIVINHLCKPDLSVINPADPSFAAWRKAMYSLSSLPKTYVKLSGLFSELPESLRTRVRNATATPLELFMTLHTWLGVVLATFGAERMMFGSDWPICTVGLDGGVESPSTWRQWYDLVEKMCHMATLNEDQRAMIFGGTAAKVYDL